MAFQVSPNVLVQERDVSLFVPQVATTGGAFVGAFNWGPAEQFVTVDSEKTLFNIFGRPDDNTFKYWFTAANFLAYGNNLQVNRIADSAARNATAQGTSILIKNQSQYQGDLGYTAPTLGSSEFVAKYPGTLGNNLKVSICDYNTYTFAASLSSTALLFSTGATVSALTRPVPKGSWIEITSGSSIYRFQTTADAATGATSLIFVNNTGITPSTTSVNVLWEYWDQVESRPNNTRYALTKAGASSSATIYDEIHVIIADDKAGITGVAGTILEKWQGLSKASDAYAQDGTSLYYKTFLNQRSAWVWWGSHTTLAATTSASNQLSWGGTSPASATSGFALLSQAVTRSFSSTAASAGIDVTPTDGLLQTEYVKLANAEQFDVSLIPVVSVGLSNSTASYVADNVADARRDCVVFASPTSSALITASAVITDRNTYFNKDSTYAVMDSGWKYQYDRYNDTYRWVPLCGDTAGLCVRTDLVADAWYSPGGYTRGQIKNLVKLSWSPGKTDRDNLYQSQINPVITQPGLGTLLFGDKTLTKKPSAFDRINVRRLFIVLEKAIATASKYQLFEFNDAFTRSQFISLVEPFLRDVQGRRGIIDFRVVCDDTNNTGDVIDRNEFVADIYIKPAKSINYITLNFVATATGVQFNEVGA
jgi:phage tail sheath protein FI